MATWAEMTESKRDDAIARLLGWHTLPDCPQLHSGDRCNSEQVPHYTTDLAAAIGLAEKMRADGMLYHIKALPYLENVHSFEVWIVSRLYKDGHTIPHFKEWKTYKTYADTFLQLPAAISECVYQALGGE